MHTANCFVYEVGIFIHGFEELLVSLCVLLAVTNLMMIDDCSAKIGELAKTSGWITMREASLLLHDIL